ncbi:HD domain-containing protein [bacterium]|nr:HD domain-containing protein [bacterium]
MDNFSYDKNNIGKLNFKKNKKSDLILNSQKAIQQAESEKQKVEYSIYPGGETEKKDGLPYNVIFGVKSSSRPSFGANASPFKRTSDALRSKHPYPHSENEIDYWLNGFMYNHKKRFDFDYCFEKELKEKVTMSNVDLVNNYALICDKTGYPRFSGGDISSLIDVSKPDNMPYIYELVNMETEDENPIFSGYNIKDLVETIQKRASWYGKPSAISYFEGIKPKIKRLSEIKITNGCYSSNVFTGSDIVNILNSNFGFTEREFDYIKELANKTTEKGEKRFRGYDIVSIIPIAYEYNKNYINELSKIESLDGETIAKLVKLTRPDDIEEIRELLKVKNAEGQSAISKFSLEYFFNDRERKINFEILKQLALIQNDEKKQRFSDLNLADLEKIANTENIDFIKELAKTKKENKEPYAAHEIVYLAKYANKGNTDFIKELMTIKSGGQLRFEPYYIEPIAKIAKPENINFIRELIKMKDDDGNPRFSADCIAKITSAAKPDKKDIIYEILNKKDDEGKIRFSGSEISSLCHYVNKDNVNIFRKLEEIRINGKPRFEAGDIRNIFYSLEKSKPEAVGILDDLLKAETKDGKPLYKGCSIGTILEKINSENIDYAKYLLKCNIDGEPAYKESNEIVQTLRGVFVKPDISLPFRDKNELLNELKYCLELSNDDKSKEIISEKIKILEKSTEKITDSIPVSKEANDEFWQNFLVSANKENKDVILNLDTIVNKYGKEGLPIEYSRVDFVKDLKAKLETLNENEQKQILKKLDIEFNKDTYEGFINLNGLDKSNPKEAEIQSLCEKLLLKNKITTGDEKTDKFLNSIIKGIPEFVNIIGKEPHGVHQYSVDLHILKVLKEVVANPKFDTLSNQDKTVAQLMALFHDIGKLGGVDDNYHEQASAVITNDIMKKMKFPVFLKKRIVELVKNHNWFEQINTGKIDAHSAALMFRNPEDLIIAEIFGEADLKGVSDAFYNNYSNQLKYRVESMKKALDAYYSTGNMIFPTRILDINKIPTEEYKGKKYKVLNIAKLPDNADLTKYGLSVKNKRDLRLIFHAGDIDTIRKVTLPFNEAVICSSMISPDKKATFWGERVGMLLDAPNANVINTANENQVSGKERDFRSFAAMTDPNEKYSCRKYQRRDFLASLNKKYNISEEDYCEIYKKLVNKEFLSQFEDITLSNGTTIKAEDLKNAYKESENRIMQNSDFKHNEINLYNPELKGIIFMGDSVEELNNSWSFAFEYAQKYDLPIFLMGKKPDDI